VKLLNQNLPPMTVPAKKLKALVFDWAGTTVDFGSLAPVRTLEQLFGSFGIPLGQDDIRRDMGEARPYRQDSPDARGSRRVAGAPWAASRRG